MNDHRDYIADKRIPIDDLADSASASRARMVLDELGFQIPPENKTHLDSSRLYLFQFSLNVSFMCFHFWSLNRRQGPPE